MTGLKDDLQELWESWLGILELWFWKMGQQESLLSLPLCFYCVVPPPPPFLLFLSCSLTPSNCGLERNVFPPLIEIFSSLCWGGGLFCCGVSKSTMPGCLQCSLLCRLREEPAIWLKQEGIYILNMPWSWHCLLSTISLWTLPVESLILWQSGRLIPCIWHWTCLSALLALTCIFYFAQNSTCQPHTEGKLLSCLSSFSSTVNLCVFFHLSIFSHYFMLHLLCLSL